MNMSPQKRFATGMRATLVGLGVIGCFVLVILMLADVSSAAVPPTGLNCVASDGKISGRGSTYQSNAQQKFAQAYRDDFCGNTGTESSEKGEAGNTMVATTTQQPKPPAARDQALG